MKKPTILHRVPTRDEMIGDARRFYLEMPRHEIYTKAFDADTKRNAYCGIKLARSAKPLIFYVGITGAAGPLLRPMCKKAFNLLAGAGTMTLARDPEATAKRPQRFGAVKTPQGHIIALAGPERDLCEAYATTLGVRFLFFTPEEKEETLWTFSNVYGKLNRFLV